MIVQISDMITDNVLTVQVKFKHAVSVVFIVNREKKNEEMFFNSSETIM